MPLSEQIIAEFAQAEKPYKRFDARGLYLLVNPNGSKYWRLKFRIAGKEKGMGLRRLSRGVPRCRARLRNRSSSTRARGYRSVSRAQD